MNEPATTEITPKNTAKTRHFPLFFVWQSLLVLLIVVALYGFVFTIKHLKHIEGEQGTLSNRITALGESQRLTQQAVSAFDQRLLIQQTQLERTKKQLEELMIEKSRLRKDWVLDEINHQVRMAALSLQYSHNVPAAINLLEAANDRLIKLADPVFNNKRQDIINDITALKAIPSIDLNGILARLSALSNDIKQLPLPTNIIPTPAGTVPSTWKEQLGQTWQYLEKIIVIRRLDKPIKPLLLPEQRIVLEQNLQLLLQEAVWSILQANQTVYQYSLDQMIEYIDRYFDQNAPITKNTLSRLKELKSININPALPRLTSYLAFQRENKFE
jgi:uroporphyrin-3 C-methyltransferase